MSLNNESFAITYIPYSAQVESAVHHPAGERVRAAHQGAGDEGPHHEAAEEEASGAWDETAHPGGAPGRGQDHREEEPALAV